MKLVRLISIVFLFPVFSNPGNEFLSPATPERILVINSFDAQSIKARKNKRLLFGELADSLKQMLNYELTGKKRAEIIVIPELISSSSNDSIYFCLIRKHSATKAIVITKLNAYFEQTDVEVTKEGRGGKSKVASYDIIADVVYVLYNDSKRIRDFETKAREFFTERSVVSGLLAAGPGIIGKYKHAFKIIQLNAEQFGREVEIYIQSN